MAEERMARVANAPPAECTGRSGDGGADLSMERQMPDPAGQARQSASATLTAHALDRSGANRGSSRPGPG